MQCKDIPTMPILRFLESLNGKWANWFDPTVYSNSVLNAMPPETPEKLAMTKMRNLIKKGVIDGCPCGCRGNYELNDRSRSMLEADNA